MEDIKFIDMITNYIARKKTIVGNAIYYRLDNGNNVKTYCAETGVTIEIINRTSGKVDGIFLPFRNYFQPTKCSANSPSWYQHIDNGHWYFEETYKHVLPKPEDYNAIAKAMEQYIKLFA